jgi:hypothetical protein
MSHNWWILFKLEKMEKERRYRWAVGDSGTQSRLVIDSASASATALFLLLSHMLVRSSNHR